MCFSLPHLSDFISGPMHIFHVKHLAWRCGGKDLMHAGPAWHWTHDELWLERAPHSHPCDLNYCKLIYSSCKSTIAVHVNLSVWHFAFVPKVFLMRLNSINFIFFWTYLFSCNNFFFNIAHIKFLLKRIIFLVFNFSHPRTKQTH